MDKKNNSRPLTSGKKHRVYAYMQGASVFQRPPIGCKIGAPESLRFLPQHVQGAAKKVIFAQPQGEISPNDQMVLPGKLLKPFGWAFFRQVESDTVGGKRPIKLFDLLSD
jgi:hypothetical protein